MRHFLTHLELFGMVGTRAVEYVRTYRDSGRIPGGLRISHARSGHHDDAQSAINIDPRSRKADGLPGFLPVKNYFAVMVRYNPRASGDLIILNSPRQAPLALHRDIRQRRDMVLINHCLAPK